MPTKRQFDLVILAIVLAHPVIGIAKIWATRKSQDPTAGNVTKVAAGAVQIVS